ncbi:MAG: hypothetical protein J7L16_02935 [Deltaproteobacteria bacterium]|nr:hypothetical protein [Deltaproteobacteria bacterium]
MGELGHLSIFRSGIQFVGLDDVADTMMDGKGKIYTGFLGGKKRHYYKYLKEYGIPLRYSYG